MLAFLAAQCDIIKIVIARNEAIWYYTIAGTLMRLLRASQ